MSFHKDLRGTDLHAPSNETVENNTGSTISKGKVVTFTGLGSGGLFPSISVLSSYLQHARGLVLADITNNSIGIICCMGVAQNLNTNSWAVGTILYVDSSGNLTATVTPIIFGEVLKQHSTAGQIYVEGGIVGPAGPTIAFKQDGSTIIASPNTLNVVAPGIKIVDAGGGQGNLKHYSDRDVTGGVTDVNGNATTVMAIGVATSNNGVAMVKNGEVFGVSVTSNAARTGGTLTVMSVIEGIAQNGPGQTTVLDATNTTKNYINFATPIQYNAGDRVTGQSVTVGFTPAAADITIRIFCRDRD